MTWSTDHGRCEWCETTQGLIEASTHDGKKLLVCKDGYACGSRWAGVSPVGRVGAYEGAAR